ncbi:uncharacterized protein ACJ7VT_012186 [Polymixia lowei]
MADEEGTIEVESGASQDVALGPDQGPLVAVSFQRNPLRKEKYLESEPKALGITQIGLSVFQINWASMVLAHDMDHPGGVIPFIVASLLVIIAGSVAIAAQNLHLPTLRACLGMQVLACIASIFNLMVAVIKLTSQDYLFSCWSYNHEENSTYTYPHVCRQVESAQSHCYAEIILIQAALIAIAITLAAYCCKVANCCSLAPKMPVITVQTPPVRQ